MALGCRDVRLMEWPERLVVLPGPAPLLLPAPPTSATNATSPSSTGAAAALTFRANADGSQRYTANVDAAGLVKLWRPGRDIAVQQRQRLPRRRGPEPLSQLKHGPAGRVAPAGRTRPRGSHDCQHSPNGRSPRSTSAPASPPPCPPG